MVADKPKPTAKFTLAKSAVLLLITFAGIRVLPQPKGKPKTHPALLSQYTAPTPAVEVVWLNVPVIVGEIKGVEFTELQGKLPCWAKAIWLNPESNSPIRNIIE